MSTRGEKVCQFIERYCLIPEGSKVGQPIKLLDFQRKFVLDVYDNPAGTSRAYLSVARKNGKSALIAAIVLAHLVGPEAKQNSQIISGARSRDQASLVFKLAEKMVRLSDELIKIVRIVPSQKSLVGLPCNVEYKAISAGHELRSVGFSPEQMQLLELQQFCIEQIARIHSLPPVFLQDLSDGTYSNTEQQDLHFVKHTLRRWIEQSEQEMNLRLFGRDSDFEVRFNVDSLLRGDLKTRMEAHATAIQNGIKTPNEVREKEGMEPLPGGDDLMIQGATVPIESQGEGEAVEVS